MKYLILLLVIGVVALLLGFKRRTPPPARRSDEPRQALTMVSCAECGLHLPVAEALPGRGGHFCSAEHRNAYETRQGGVQ
nr:PP0621 family protein [uncultured Roseateles sp.]